MKLVKTASGKTNIKISQKEWQSLGKKAGWMNKEAGLEELLTGAIQTLAVHLKNDLNFPEIDSMEKAYDMILKTPFEKVQELVRKYSQK